MPERVELMFLSFRRALSSNYEPYVISALAILLAICFYLVLPHGRRRRREPAPDEPKRLPDREFFEMVVSQKGLEEADRAALLRLGERLAIEPLYGVLLRKHTFDRHLAELRAAAAASPEPGVKADLQRLEALRDRLFPI